MNENEQQTANNVSTQNLDMNSRIIQPPTTGEGINTPRPEQTKNQMYQPQQTINATSQQPSVSTDIEQQSADKPFIPTYAKSTINDSPKDYVAGGIYVIASIMMAPVLYFIYMFTLMAITYGINSDLLVALLSSNIAVAVGYIVAILLSAFGGVMLFKQKRIGLIMAIIAASILLIYGIFSIIQTSGAVILFFAATNSVKLYTFNIIVLDILLPILIISYLLQQKVRDFASR